MGRRVPRRLARWLAPDLAFVAASVALFLCLVPFDGYRQLFRDSDAGWHIRTGEAILSTGTLPRTDPYSFTRGGQPWFAWEWGADVLMGAAHRAGGLRAVALLYAAAMAAGVWLWFRLHWLAGGDFLLACVMAAPMLSTCSLHWLARPHVFSWIFLLGAVFWAERARQGRPPGLWAVALGAALWANVHASFFFAPLIAAIYAAGERPKARWFATAGAVAAAASFLNPYGWGLHLHVFRYLTDSELLARIGEFQSFNFHASGAGQVLLALGIAAAGGVLALEQRKAAHFLLAAALLAVALRSARGLPVAALLLLPLANGAITAAARKLSFWDYSRGLRAIDARLGGLALAPLVLAAFWFLPARAGFPPEQFPVAAAAAIEKLPADARLLAPDKFGGYLIYRFAGSRKVFFDGRSDLYGAGFLKDYGRMMQARPGWRAQVEAFGFTHALLPNDAALTAALEAAGWRRLLRNGPATLLERGPHGST